MSSREQAWRTMALAWVAVLAACGPDLESTGGAGHGGATSSSTDGAGGFTDCESPSGYRICNGIHNCSNDPDDCGCLSMGDDPLNPDLFGICLNVGDWLDWINQGEECIDGGLMIEVQDGMFWCSPWELGMLFCGSDEGRLVRYRDYAPYDCDGPVPTPAECVETATLRLCGDACGSCQENEVCGGRSKAHPYSFCFPESRDSCRAERPCQTAGESCFTFSHSDPETQAIAEREGFCLPDALCRAAASELPGGGQCTAP
ncbi:MAG: hypothetical protein U0271_39795 [Polyangiaceae bacterium]